MRWLVSSVRNIQSDQASHLDFPTATFEVALDGKGQCSQLVDRDLQSGTEERQVKLRVTCRRSTAWEVIQIEAQLGKSGKWIELNDLQNPFTPKGTTRDISANFSVVLRLVEVGINARSRKRIAA
jgi:hypothetical protein